MRTSTTNLIAILTIVAVGLTASTASAGGNNKNKKGGFSISFGGWGGNHNFCHDQYPYKKVYRVYPTYITTCYRPFHRYCWVLPGDTWYTIAQREYGNANFCHYVASYNSLSMSSPLVAGQQLLLPEIHPNGVLRASTAPVPAPFVAPAAQAAPQNVTQAPAAAAPSAPAANIRTASEEASLPSVAIGSVLELDGQSLGDTAGSVRLRIGNMALPVEVLSWNASAAKIRLPEMDLTSSIRAEIEVLRADGSLASKSAVQLTPAATRLALGN